MGIFAHPLSCGARHEGGHAESQIMPSQVGDRIGGAHFKRRSYWILGSSAPMLSEKCNVFLRPLKNKGFKEERVTTMRLDDLGHSTTLESNKSLL
jgi:hypothetical protein